MLATYYTDSRDGYYEPIKMTDEAGFNARVYYRNMATGQEYNCLYAAFVTRFWPTLAEPKRLQK